MHLEKQPSHQARTIAAMHDTADELFASADTLHGSGQRSPNETTTDRLHALGDEVTTQAHDIDRRAERLTDQTPSRERAQSSDAHTGRRTTGAGASPLASQ